MKGEYIKVNCYFKSVTNLLMIPKIVVQPAPSNLHMLRSPLKCLRRCFSEKTISPRFRRRGSEDRRQRGSPRPNLFFPRGGGQVGDTGESNGIRVNDTIKDEGLNVIYILEREPDFKIKIGDVDNGMMDWAEDTRLCGSTQLLT